MTIDEVQRVADEADVIIDGYAVTSSGSGYRVLNLHNPSHASVYDTRGHMIETSMDDIELSIVQDYLTRSMRYLGVAHA